MPSYRIDEASTGRAGCQNKECKDNKVKILKGELRLGTWVDTERFQSFFWRHWGCVTPKIIANFGELVGDDKDLSTIDGFDELSPENQEKVKKAVEQGHVDDEDWKGDPEMNQPGKTGFRKRVSKKNTKNDADGEKEEDSEEEAPISASKPKKRGRAEVEKDFQGDEDNESNDSEEEAPKAKRTKKAAAPAATRRISPREKKAAAPASEEDEAPAAASKPKAAKRGRPAKGASKENPPSGTQKRQRKTKADGKDDAEAEAETRPRRGRKKKAN
ncbi:hypothetical protein AOCH_002889 [Aspergillus ochraceoroseus]|uniref:PARP-type domain-containing protein n=1 Tax=Aspergillus ochraceoroseus TaxID=138278 RepID=A0A0F8X5F2_9EURO|nr:hypothetical protein AOCH_002889 [Aspergillus ochraceoroseus]